MFTDTLNRWLASVRDAQTAQSLKVIIGPLFDRTSTRMLNTAGLAIKAAGGVLVKTGATDAYALVKGDLVKITSATDMAALAGTVTNGRWNVFCFFIDGVGTKTSAMGQEATTLAGVNFPQFPEGKALIGFIVVNPTGTGNFVGNTTALDDATVIPNTVYLSPVSGFDPACVIS